MSFQIPNFLAIIFDLVLLLLTLYSMAILVEKFLLELIQKISTKYNFSEQTSGYMLAIGNSIPEFTTNLIASLSHDQNLLKFGIGAITGSGTYDFTICLSFASFFIIYSDYPSGLLLDKSIFIKNSIIYLLTLGLLQFFLWDSIINIFEALVLCLLFPFCIYLNNKFEERIRNQVSESVDLREGIDFDKKNPQIQENMLNVNDANDNNENDTRSSSVDIIISKIEKSVEDNSVQRKKNCIQKFCDVVSYILNGFVYILEKIITKFFSITVPLNYSLVISTIVLAILIYYQTNIVIYCIEQISNFSGISTWFLGMTLISWGNNVGDTISASVSAKLGKADLLISGIYGAQILNLQFCLGFPWLLSVLTSPNLQIHFDTSQDLKYFFVSFILVILVICTFIIFRMRLNRFSGVVLIFIYLGYLIFEYIY